jgi:hypothetical protein
MASFPHGSGRCAHAKAPQGSPLNPDRRFNSHQRMTVMAMKKKSKKKKAAKKKATS